MRNRLTLFCIFLAFTVQSQVTEGGLPPTFQPENQAFLSGKMPALLELQTLDKSKALKEDSQTPGQNRFAAPVIANISLENSGVWYTSPNGDRVWLCALRSQGALGLTLIFNEFKLPPGAKFYAYGANQQVLGAYTTQSCLPSGKFLIGVLKGETAYLELYEPASVQGQSKVSTKRVDVSYDANALNGAEYFGQSLPCNVNINCATGAGWQTQKKGVVRILMVFPDGEGWCSGTLIANTANTYEPYLLTAHHCQLLLNNPEFDLWRYDFDYESTNCSNPLNEPVPRSVLGSERISYRSQTDFLLLKLNPIPLNFDIYFNGWNRDDNIATLPPSTTFIHHPWGDIKKVSVDTGIALVYASTLPWGGIYGTSPASSHWKSITDIGLFESGSSGSPYFDANKRIVGQLHGGSTDMGDSCRVTGVYFGRFNLSWNQGNAPESRLKEWLDPGNTGAVTQNGYARPAVQGFSISGNLKTHWDVPMEEIRVEIGGGSSGFVYTDSLGNFQFVNIPAGGTYSIKPVHDLNDLNGVTTYDLVLISKHILAIETLNSPWKMIAADANQSGSITTFDIVETRKIILGINQAFPTNTSWRFLPAYTIFGNPANPFMGGLPPDNISVINLQANYTGANFKGIKVADVNNTAIGN